MPRRVHARGRPGSTVFPPDWQATHAAAVATTFDSVVRIAPAGQTPQWSEEHGQTVTQPAAAVYTGPASIQPASDADRTAEVVDEQASLRRYEVKLPVDVAGIDPDQHYVFVTTSPDADLAGERLAVDTVERGDRRFARVLHATLDD